MNKFYSINEIKPDSIDIVFRNDDIEIDDYSISLCTLKVSGEYPYGSSGAHIGEYLRGVSLMLREVYEVSGVVLDFSDMDYEWGNNLRGVIEPSVFTINTDYFDTWSGFYVVTSKNNRASLESLFGTSREVKGYYTDAESAKKAFTADAKKLFKD